jgi:hypothetical protein
MALTITEPEIIERGAYCVVGSYAVCEGDDEPWGDAMAAFGARREDISNRKGDALLAFLYRPHRDDPSVDENVRACFIGVEVADLDHVPHGMATTRFSGGKFVTVECRGDTENEAAMGVGEAVAGLEKWIGDNGYTEGDSCFCFSREQADTPPFIQYVHIKLEEAG